MLIFNWLVGVISLYTTELGLEIALTNLTAMSKFGNKLSEFVNV